MNWEEVIVKFKQLFCGHIEKEVIFVGVRRKNDELVKTIFSECKECGKILKYDEPKKKYSIGKKDQIGTYYGGANPND